MERVSRKAFLWSVLALVGCSERTCSEEPPDWCAVGGRGILVLVDRTTPFLEIEKGQIRQSLNAIREGLQSGDELQLGSIEDLHANSQAYPLDCFPQCSPNDGNCSRGGALVAESNFRADLDDALARLLVDQPELTNSDIAATIAGAVRGFSSLRPVSDLYIFSDMIENSQHMPKERLFALPVDDVLRSFRQSDAMPTMRGASVRIVGMGRDHATHREPITAEQMNQLRAVWNAYFTEATGTPPSYESVITH